MCHANLFRSYEREAIAMLCGRALSHQVLERVFAEAEVMDLEHTGVGYFLTVRHDALPSKRHVCDDPIVVGHANDVFVGFLVFLQDNELTLECHGWGGAVRHDVRDLPLTVGSEGKAAAAAERGTED